MKINNNKNSNNDSQSNSLNRKNIVIIIITLIIVIGLGISFAYFYINTSYDESLANINSNIECLDISFEDSNLISLRNSYPMTDDYALSHLTPVTINVTNNCTNAVNDSYYSLVLTTLSNETGYIDDNKIRTKIIRNINNNGAEVLKNTNYLNTLNLATEGNVYNLIINDLNKRNDVKNYSNKTVYIVDNSSIGAGETNTYNIYLWIDYYEGDSGVYNGEEHNASYDNTTSGKDFISLISIVTNISDKVINYHSNFDNDEVITEHYLGSSDITLKSNPFINNGYIFKEWNTMPDGSGTSYRSEEVISNLNTAYLDLYAQWADGIAEINGRYYKTLQAAINACGSSETTIKILDNISENVTISIDKNIILDLRGFTLSNKTTSAVINNAGTLTVMDGTIRMIYMGAPANPVIENNNTVTVISGTITSNGGAACINNNTNSNLYINGGEIIATGTRQAVYNNGGNLEISGDAYLSSAIAVVDKDRGTVQNLSGSTLLVKGGTIVSTGVQPAILNEGLMTIGIQDGSVSTTTPLMQGENIGIKSTTNFSMYDGIVKSKETVVNDETKITTIESEYYVVHGHDKINNEKYDTLYLANSVCTILFNANIEDVDNSTRKVECGKSIGMIPNLTKQSYILQGWYSSATNGDLITEDQIVETDMEVFAHWREYEVAEINGTYYKTLKAAIDAAGKTQTTIKLLDNIAEDVTIASGKNILLDLQGFTLSRTASKSINITNRGTLTVSNGTIKNTYSSSTAAVIENYGTLYITSGTITSNGGAGCVNTRPNAKTYMSGGKIIATGTRQALYNYENGIVEISGTAYLKSSIANTDKDRGTVHNLANGTVTIKSGTIVSTTSEPAVYNEGTLTIGIHDGNVSTTSPVIQGNAIGIKSIANYSMYDGIVKSINVPINDETKITDKENGYYITHGIETINNDSYNTAYLTH